MTSPRTVKCKNIQDFKQTIDEWISNSESGESPFSDQNGNPYEQIVDIGKQLNEIGGYDFMLRVAKSISLEHQRPLEFAWSGIGEWNP
jgi:hypothetical protein